MRASASTFPTLPVRPFAAIAAATRLFLNPQDTRQVALLEIAIGGYSNAKLFERFLRTEAGHAILRERRCHATLLDDHAYLQTLPPNSLGRHYLAHMQREGLSVQGLLEATPAVSAHVDRLPEPVRLFLDHAVRCSHDLHHVISGYGRDELGEACVLALGYQHLKIRGYVPIFTLGPFAIRRHFKRLGADPSGIFAAIREAARIGRQCAWLPALDIPAILPEDIETLRARLSLATRVIYNTITARLRATTQWRSGPLAHVQKT